MCVHVGGTVRVWVGVCDGVWVAVAVAVAVEVLVAVGTTLVEVGVGVGVATVGYVYSAQPMSVAFIDGQHWSSGPPISELASAWRPQPSPWPIARASISS